MRCFGAIGYPPERFYRAAITALVVPSEANMTTLRTVWSRLTFEERGILGVSRLKKTRNEQQVRALCTGIVHAYMARRSWEMTPSCVHRVRQAQLHAAHI